MPPFGRLKFKAILKVKNQFCGMYSEEISMTWLKCLSQQGYGAIPMSQFVSALYSIMR
jgi:hypothetical protein